jgi:hypothetical protein
MFERIRVKSVAKIVLSPGLAILTTTEPNPEKRIIGMRDDVDTRLE